MLALLGLSRRGVPAPRVSSCSSWGQALRQDVGGRGSRLPPKAWGLSHFDLKVGREPGGAAAPGRHAASRDAEAEPRGARLPPGTLPTAPPPGGLRCPPAPTGDALSPKLLFVALQEHKVGSSAPTPH